MIPRLQLGPCPRLHVSGNAIDLLGSDFAEIYATGTDPMITALISRGLLDPAKRKRVSTAS